MGTATVIAASKSDIPEIFRQSPDFETSVSIRPDTESSPTVKSPCDPFPTTANSSDVLDVLSDNPLSPGPLSPVYCQGPPIYSPIVQKGAWEIHQAVNGTQLYTRKGSQRTISPFSSPLKHHPPVLSSKLSGMPNNALSPRFQTPPHLPIPLPQPTPTASPRDCRSHPLGPTPPPPAPSGVLSPTRVYQLESPILSPVPQKNRQPQAPASAPSPEHQPERKMPLHPFNMAGPLSTSPIPQAPSPDEPSSPHSCPPSEAPNPCEASPGKAIRAPTVWAPSPPLSPLRPRGCKSRAASPLSVSLPCMPPAPQPVSPSPMPPRTRRHINPHLPASRHRATSLSETKPASPAPITVNDLPSGTRTYRISSGSNMATLYPW